LRGKTYQNPTLIPEAVAEYQRKEKARKQEKELQCLMKLKAKYEGIEA